MAHEAYEIIRAAFMTPLPSITCNADARILACLALACGKPDAETLCRTAALAEATCHDASAEWRAVYEQRRDQIPEAMTTKVERRKAMRRAGG
jgi:hypothetical protein